MGGISHHGKWHAELMELTGEAVNDNSERRRRLVTDGGGTVVNLYWKQVVWTHDLRSLPSLVIGDVFVYLTTNCDWTRERLKQFKQDDGFKMYLDKHVEDMEVG